ncbi:hypothetical protein ANCDUO_05594 [Ancylostoma duodenale]|uniref:Uncharacterized protein n=1 Tax=Ancylostoma duodenale TaxID=51022 RepID=A0A0C2GYA8_9BILA|nr:hypothetical protein ANCDUO_05594 [Ancylostoma duodenale]
MRDASQRQPLDKSRQQIYSTERQAHNRETTDPMVRLLHKVVQGKMQYYSCPSNGQNLLNDSDTREGRNGACSVYPKINLIQGDQGDQDESKLRTR